MKYTTIRIEGSIFSSDILDKLEQGDLGGQRSEDFNFEARIKVKDEIARAWADAHDLWRIFSRQRDRLGEKGTGTSETRKYWILPLLGILGYDAELAERAEEISGKSYAISHRAAKLDSFPIHIMGYKDSLDKKREDSGPRMSPHALVQEYLNITEHLYAIVTNGLHLRLLRDSSRLVKLSFIEFDLQSMMEEEHFADFAIMYRLLHASRMPIRQDGGAESLIEKYHQDALDSGSRIREGLSEAVENSIKSLADGFLNHPANNELWEALESGRLDHFTFYQHQLHLIYRLLFLMVIEERNLIYPPNADQRKVRIYYDYYSIGHLRQHCEKVHLMERGYNDLWIAMKNTFRLFEKEYYGQKLDIKPLGGELFSPNAIGILNQCHLDNSVLLECLRNLSVFTNKNNNQKMRVNYASLNVEEFGSVYEGLLEYDPLIEKQNSHWRFLFIRGEGRSSSGSHYTPDELVQPLIKHSLDYVIEEKLKEPDKEKALLSIKVCDVACGSGHILLNAARRIATELAKVRTGEDQPSPAAFREAVRDVIRTCIYGVDKNPLAVELCKIALWLEAHNPDGPLNFLDHHIKCGDSIVGLAHMEELQKGIAEEAFKSLPGDDKDICASLRKVNKAERGKQLSFDFQGAVGENIKDIAGLYKRFSELPERTPEEIEEKRKAYLALTTGEDWYRLKTLADIQVAQFFIPKDKENQAKITTDGTYRQYLAGEKKPLGQAVAMAEAVAGQKRFFHWFLEFPEVFAEGGFDCILGNPPYLGGQGLSGNYGQAFCEYVRWGYAPTGLSDLVVYFVRRIYTLLNPGGFTSFITTNSIKDGDNRRDGLDQVMAQGGEINMAVRGVKWPGRANVVVSLVAIHKGNWKGKRILDGRAVPVISSYFEDSMDAWEPQKLPKNIDSVYQGTIFLGDGFLLTHDEADRLVKADSRNAEVVFPVINGKEVNNDPVQAPARSIINFHDWDEERAKLFPMPFEIVLEKVKPERLKQKDSNGREYWWRFLRPRIEMTNAIRSLGRCFVTARVTKHLNFSSLPTNYVYLNNLYVFTTDRWDLYAVVQTTLHEVWARKYSMSLKQDLQYSPSDCFDTFPFPKGLWQTANPILADLGERYHENRRVLMRHLWLGLTDIYNLFHTRDLTPAVVAKVSKKLQEESEKGYQGIIELRRLHRQLDESIRDAYGWTDMLLRHDFYEVDYLPENDRTRFTIHPHARKEVLKCLLELNHKIHEEEVRAEEEAKLTQRTVKKPQKKSTATTIEPSLFDLPMLEALSYPGTHRDKLINAAALSIVEKAGDLSSMDHLDALLLATHPEWCKAFLDPSGRTRFEAAAVDVPTGFFVEGNASIMWKDCRDYLEKRKALRIDRSSNAQTIRIGENFADVKASLPSGVDSIIDVALEALKEVQRLRQRIDSASEGQKPVLQIFEHQHQEYRLAA